MTVHLSRPEPRSHPKVELKTRRDLKRAAQVGFALVAAGLLTLIYLRTL